MAEVLAIWGAITGTAALSLRLIEFLRDRPKLSVRANANIREGEPASISVAVANNGRQPTTIVDAGFVVAVEFEMRNERWPEDRPADVILPRLSLSSTAKLIPPGEVADFTHQLLEWPYAVHADFPLRGYAVDSKGRTWWGGAIPMLRRLLQTGWQPPEGTPSEALAPGGHIDAVPVAPRWKWWTPAGHRKTGHGGPTGPPSFNFPLGRGGSGNRPEQ